MGTNIMDMQKLDQEPAKQNASNNGNHAQMHPFLGSCTKISFQTKEKMRMTVSFNNNTKVRLNSIVLVFWQHLKKTVVLTELNRIGLN